MLQADYNESVSKKVYFRAISPVVGGIEEIISASTASVAMATSPLNTPGDYNHQYFSGTSILAR